MSAITKEMLEQKLMELRQSRDELAANLSATVGAIQSYEFLLTELSKPSEPEKEVRK